MPSTLQIQLFGHFLLRSDKAPVASFDSPRLQALLAYLLLHREAPHPRQLLAFRLWPDTPEAQARANLRTALHRLRRALPDADQFLEVEVQTVLWRSDAPFVLDVAEFEGALGEAARAEGRGDRAGQRLALQAAVDLYRGDFLPGCYDEWLLPERERLRLRFSGALEQLLLLLETARDYRAAIRYAQRLLQHDPLHETTYQHLMRLHALSGDQASALRAYLTCAAVLERELGAAPSPATRAAYEALRRPVPAPAEPSARPTPPAPERRRENLPIALTSFVGRAREVAEARRMFGTGRLLTLTGAGGSGKSRLALAVAAELVSHYPDGVWLVELAPLAEGALVPEAVAAALGVHKEPHRPLAATLVEALQARTLLLVLDNCEHLISACAELAEQLLSACPGLSVLATSREALGVAGEIAWRVPRLSLPDPMTTARAELLERSEAVQLFVDRAGLALPTFTLTDAHAPAVAEVCRRLDGIPLAIELAAARVKLLTVEQLAVRLNDSLRLLTSGSRTAVPRHQTLRAAIDWSYDLLSGPEQALFRRFSVFAGGWTLEAAEAVGGEGALELLAQLVDKSLVAVEAQDGQTARYQLLDTVRQYGLEKLGRAGEAEAIAHRHAQFFLELAQAAEPELTGPQQGLWLDRLEAEHDNLRQALAWAQTPAGEAELGLQLAASLGHFWDMRGYLGEGRRSLEALLARVATRTAVRAKALDEAGWLAYSQGDNSAAHALHEESLLIWRELGDVQGIARALSNLGNAAWRQADYTTARRFHEESLKLQRELGAKRGVAASLHNLGMVAWHQRDYAAARALFEESLALKRELGDKWGIATSLNALGVITFEMGDVAAARPLYLESVKLAQELGDKVEIAMALTNLGEVALVQGDYKEARERLAASLVLKRELGNQWGIANSLSILGLVGLGQGDTGVAGSLFAESLSLRRSLDDRRGIAHCLAGLAGVAWAQAQPERAARLLGATEGLLDALGSRLEVADRALYDRHVEALRESLSADQLAVAWAGGRALSLEAAISEALRAAEPPLSPPAPAMETG